MSYNSCPKCGGTRLIRLSSQRIIICADGCGKLPWELKENQKPLVSSNRNMSVAKTKRE